MKTLFVNGQYWDATCEHAVPGEVLLDGAKIAAVTDRPGSLPRRVS